MTGKGYSLDTNILVESWRRLYRPKTFASFWANLEDLIERGSARATDEVRVEVDKRDDELKVWCKEHPDLFVPHETDIQRAVRDALVHCQRMVGSHKGHNGADPWVIALAKARGLTVVTMEAWTGNMDKLRIPDVCDQLGVPWLTLYDWIDEQNWTF